VARSKRGGGQCARCVPEVSLARTYSDEKPLLSPEREFFTALLLDHPSKRKSIDRALRPSSSLGIAKRIRTVFAQGLTLSQSAIIIEYLGTSISRYFSVKNHLSF
jgi:hypothetical protein